MTPERNLPPALVAALASLAGAALVLVAVMLDASAAAVAVLVAIGLLLPVRVPWGGSVPIGSVPIVATAALLSHLDAAATLGVALLVGGVLVACRSERATAILAVARYSGSVVGALVATLAVDAAFAGPVPMLAAALGAGAGLVVGDLAVTRLSPAGTTRIELRSAIPVHLTLACASILVAVAVHEVGVPMAAVAAFPLLITRFSFDRYAGATDTLDQTVQALGLVPELAGLAPLGHSERSATYALALARELGFDRRTRTRIITATRLHHIGAVPLESADDGPLEPTQIAENGARILLDSGISADVADLLAAAKADALDAVAPSLEAAVVRVAATFDDLVGDDATAADRGLALLGGAARDPHSRRATAALLELVATKAGLVRDAIAAGDRFREAAVGLDLESITAVRGGSGELLPFTRRG